MCVPSRLVMLMFYTLCVFIGIFYAVVRQISMLFIDNKDSVFCNHTTRNGCVVYTECAETPAVVMWHLPSINEISP